VFTGFISTLSGIFILVHTERNRQILLTDYSLLSMILFYEFSTFFLEKTRFSCVFLKKISKKIYFGLFFGIFTAKNSPNLRLSAFEKLPKGKIGALFFSATRPFLGYFYFDETQKIVKM